MLTLADILTSKVDCLHPEADLKSAFQTLTINNYSCCVVAAENRIPLGILTERDLVQIICKEGSSGELMWVVAIRAGPFRAVRSLSRPRTNPNTRRAAVCSTRRSASIRRTG